MPPAHARAEKSRKSISAQNLVSGHLGAPARGGAGRADVEVHSSDLARGRLPTTVVVLMAAKGGSARIDVGVDAHGCATPRAVRHERRICTDSAVRAPCRAKLLADLAPRRIANSGGLVYLISKVGLASDRETRATWFDALLTLAGR
jgi:hypothetical protein